MDHVDPLDDALAVSAEEEMRTLLLLFDIFIVGSVTVYCFLPERRYSSYDGFSRWWWDLR